jgi:hypothetical protein
MQRHGVRCWLTRVFAAMQAAAPKKEVNPLYEKRTKTFGECSGADAHLWASAAAQCTALGLVHESVHQHGRWWVQAETAVCQGAAHAGASGVPTGTQTPVWHPWLRCTAGLGGAPPPKRDLHRFVKWPKYVRIQRQRRVLSMRLKVPPVLNQFVTRTIDKNQVRTAPRRRRALLMAQQWSRRAAGTGAGVQQQLPCQAAGLQCGVAPLQLVAAAIMRFQRPSSQPGAGTPLGVVPKLQ